MAELVRKYSIGSGIVEAHEAKILADLAAMYPDEGQRQTVVDVLLPHFREELIRTFDQFREDEKLNLDQPVVPAQLPGLCSVVDEMIEGNKALLDLGGMFKPVIERIQAVRGEIAETLKAQFYQHCREILAGHGVTDRQGLLRKGPEWFMGADFSPYGKGSAFAGKILEESLKYTGITYLEQIADVLGLPVLSEESKKLFREALGKHGVTDRQSLLRKGPKWFSRADFPPYGKGVAFAGKILGKFLKYIELADLGQIADALGFEKPSREAKLQEYRDVLARCEITDRQGLLDNGTVWFHGTDFSPYGKGIAFAGEILGRTVAPPVRVSDLEEIAKVLGFKKPTRRKELQKCREVLAKHGVTDRQSLFGKGPEWFLRADFSPYGKGFAFARKILGRKMKGGIRIADIEEIADILWPTVSSNEN